VGRDLVAGWSAARQIITGVATGDKVAGMDQGVILDGKLRRDVAR